MLKISTIDCVRSRTYFLNGGKCFCGIRVCRLTQQMGFRRPQLAGDLVLILLLVAI